MIDAPNNRHKLPNDWFDYVGELLEAYAAQLKSECNHRGKRIAELEAKLEQQSQVIKIHEQRLMTDVTDEIDRLKSLFLTGTELLAVVDTAFEGMSEEEYDDLQPPEKRGLDKLEAQAAEIEGE